MMTLALTTDRLLKSVGKRVHNDQGKYLGEIIEVTRNSAGGYIEYAILKSDQLFDNEERFFAIPVCSDLMKIIEIGEIVLSADREELHFSDAIMGKHLPHQNLRVNPNIFELFEYDSLKQNIKLVQGE